MTCGVRGRRWGVGGVGPDLDGSGVSGILESGSKERKRESQ